MKFKKAIIISVLLVLCTSIITVSVTYAWFKNYKTNKVLTNQVMVSSSSVFLVSSTPDGDPGTTLQYNFDGLILDDVTGNGITFLSVPLNNVDNLSEHNVDYFGLYSSIPNTDENAVWNTAISTDGENNLDTAQYISIDVYFQASIKAYIYLGANSYVSPASETLVGEDSDNISAYGNFSKDCIAGAARVSFLDYTDNDNPTTCKVWIPNSKYELSYAKGEGWNMNLDGQPENKISKDSGYYYYTEDASGKIKKYLNVDDPEKPNPKIVTTVPNGGLLVTTLKESTEEEGKYIGHIKINIWIEGCDREARRALAGGNLTVKLDFTAKEITG